MFEIFEIIIKFVKSFGYIGIFIMTFIESTFIPIPAEVTMLPAGFLASQGEMNFWVVLLVSIIGTVLGSYFTYYIAFRYGRKLVKNYGKYLFLNDSKIAKMEAYFREHGPISVFTGRLIPGLRHYISFPAGLAQMNLKIFCIYTAVGGGIWMGTLLAIGYLIGANQEMLNQYLFRIKIILLIFIAILAIFYIFFKKNKKKYNSHDIDINKK